MILTKPLFQILKIMGDDSFGDPSNSLGLIETAGRTCYKSVRKESEIPDEAFIEKLISNGHESVIEHSSMSIRFICDRGISHELVRHRLCAFSQESTRYVNYKGGCTFIIPSWLNILPGNYDESFKVHSAAEFIFIKGLLEVERNYIQLLNEGWSPQQARTILPNATKTELIMTTNFREWRHILKLRTSKSAHPQMRELMIPLLSHLQSLIPVIFDDIKGI